MSELEMMALIKKLQEQMDLIERKIDILVKRSPERPINQDRNFSKPFKSYGGPPRHFKGPHDHGPRKEYGGPKKEYGHKNEFSQEHSFEKRSGGKAHGFNPHKKPFFKKTSFAH